MSDRASQDDSGNPPNASTSKALDNRLIVAILVACVAGWVGFSFPPKTWNIPDDMIHIGALSPAKDQERLAAVELANLWKNSILKFSLAGLGVGLCGFVFQGGRNIGVSIATLIGGGLFGAAAGAIGLVVRRYLNQGHPIPLISESSRPLFCDSVVFVIISALLVCPVALLLILQSNRELRQKALSAPLAGVLTGLFVPFLGALVLPTYSTTSSYPPSGISLTILWFAALAAITLGLCVFMGGKKAVATEAELEAA